MNQRTKFTLTTKALVFLAVVSVVALPQIGFAQSNSAAGTWKLNLAKSKYSPGLPHVRTPSATYKIPDQFAAETPGEGGINKDWHRNPFPGEQGYQPPAENWGKKGGLSGSGNGLDLGRPPEPGEFGRPGYGYPEIRGGIQYLNRGATPSFVSIVESTYNFAPQILKSPGVRIFTYGTTEQFMIGTQHFDNSDFMQGLTAAHGRYGQDIDHAFNQETMGKHGLDTIRQTVLHEMFHGLEIRMRYGGPGGQMPVAPGLRAGNLTSADPSFIVAFHNDVNAKTQLEIARAGFAHFLDPSELFAEVGSRLMVPSQQQALFDRLFANTIANMRPKLESLGLLAAHSLRGDHDVDHPG